MKRLLSILAAIVFALQLVPYGRKHSNPPVLREPNWDSPATAATFDAACADCHSNQTRWPWYSFVAPASWLIQKDVDEGRAKFNVSEMGRAKNDADEAAEIVLSGEMPLKPYLPLHPEARLTPEQRRQFAAGLAATFGREGGHGGAGQGNETEQEAEEAEGH
ncbi:MAG: heme-binding domain-containing protein [Candidatus Eisenbacteria bacterium]|nr:heme-binding domain-containing protein [Candidatus Eisenbacteria bacterium]